MDLTVSMVDKHEKETEDKILEAARKVFIRRGYDGARMQEIADEAGYNKSMVHYYYRDKDHLFHKVFVDAAKQMIPPVIGILEEDLELMEKIDKFIRVRLDTLEAHPYIFGFVIQELHNHPERFPETAKELDIHLPVKFIQQVNEAVEAGKIAPISPVQLMINILALCVFPYVGGHMIKAIMHLSDEDYAKLLKERKESLPQFIRKALQPL